MSVNDLAMTLIARGEDGRHVKLTPATAYRIGLLLRTSDAKPTRDEVAILICRQKSTDRCKEPCFECCGRANEIVRAYGQRVDSVRR